MLMKKIFVFALLAATVAALSSCSEDDETDDEGTIEPIVYYNALYSEGAAGATLIPGDKTRTYVDWVQLWEKGPKWATINIGVTSTEATGTDLYGGYYCWGMTTNKDSKNEYCTRTSAIRGTTYDTAKNLWGERWEMPT